MFSRLHTLAIRVVSTVSVSVARRSASPALARSLFTLKGGPKHALSAYAKPELLEKEAPEDVRRIWLQFHSSKACISAAIPTETAKLLSDRLEESPDFVLPLPLVQSDGGEYTVMYQQGTGNVIQYTSVHEFNSYREHALPYLNLYFYDELAESKGLVLMRGDVNAQKMTVEQAQMLMHHVQIYYLSPVHYRFAEVFNKRPKEFDFEMMLLNTRAIMSGQSKGVAKIDVNSSDGSGAKMPGAAADEAQA
jgi:ATP synthase F1 complex assembly factor 1